MDVLCQSLALALGPLSNVGGTKLEFANAGCDVDSVLNTLVNSLVKFWSEDYLDYRKANPNKANPVLTDKAIKQQIEYITTLDTYTGDFVPFAQAKLSAYNAGLITTKELNKMVTGTPQGIAWYWAEKIDNDPGSPLHTMLENTLGISGKIVSDAGNDKTNHYYPKHEFTLTNLDKQQRAQLALTYLMDSIGEIRDIWANDGGRLFPVAGVRLRPDFELVVDVTGDVGSSLPAVVNGFPVRVVMCKLKQL